MMFLFLLLVKVIVANDDPGREGRWEGRKGGRIGRYGVERVGR